MSEKLEPPSEFVKELLTDPSKSVNYRENLNKLQADLQQKLDKGLPPEQAAKTKDLLEAIKASLFILELIPNFYRSAE